MNCRKPMVIGTLPLPCGQCLPCRINRRRVWTHRIILEANEHANNAFVTLTYDPENLPVNANGIPTLRPDDFQKWLKRLRFRTPQKIRFFGCGEYGKDQPGSYGRPHYHAVLFNYAGCLRGSPHGTCSCDSCLAVRETWGHGITHCGHLSPASAAYVAGYVTKKVGLDDDTARAPCFARMSLRPGVGLDSVHEVASTVMQHQSDLGMVDVPVALRHGEKMLPLGPTYRRKLRKALGRPQNAPDEVVLALQAKVQDVLIASRSSSEGISKLVARKYAGACDHMEAALKLKREKL
ncbi:MAG: replication initiator protein [Microvirus sp.]|nr:MAG: replication initiator protein [Microvirus sp.]